MQNPTIKNVKWNFEKPYTRCRGRTTKKVEMLLSLKSNHQKL